MVRHAGWPKNLAGFQGPFLPSLQALSDPQEGKNGGPWVWGVRKPYTGDIVPSQHYGCASSTYMCINGRRGGNGKPRQQQPNIISDPNLSTRDNFGALQATSSTTGPDKGKNTNHKENITRQEDKGS